MTNVYLYLGMFVFWVGGFLGLAIACAKLYWIIYDWYKDYSWPWQLAMMFKFWIKYIRKKDTPYVKKYVENSVASFDNPKSKDYNVIFKGWWKRNLNVLLQRDSNEHLIQ